MPKSSPEYLQVSLAAAITLGLRKGFFYRNAKLFCLNLLLTYPEGCRASCTYCGLAKGAKQTKKSFIRVDWPMFPTDLVIEKAGHSPSFERACISTLTHPNNMKDTLEVLSLLCKKTKLPVSILSNPTTTSVEDIKTLHDAGADRFTVAIDLATENLFERHRGSTVKGPHKWKRYWKTLEEAAPIFGERKIGAHLIAGMGETEREMVGAIQKVYDAGGTTHLFSFYPEAGSSLENAKPCDAGQYRRVQLARYLIDNGLSSYGRMSFDHEGKIEDAGLEPSEREAIIDSGRPFETCGCPGKGDRQTACNRPYGDGPPSDIRSYPFALEAGDVKRVRIQMNGRITPKEISGVEQIKDLKVEPSVWKDALSVRPSGSRRIGLYLPSFKNYSTSELSNTCSNGSFPAVSLTGKNCALMCDHCRGRLLESMIPAETPEALLKTARRISSNGSRASGILISGGSDRQNRIDFGPFLKTIEKIKSSLGLNIAVHTGLIDRQTAEGLSSAGVDTAMMDIIGSDETIGKVYHLDKKVEDFEESLANLCATSMKVAPHIVVGLHYGRLVGERTALRIAARHPASSLIVVVALPYYAKDPAMFPSPSAEEVGKFLIDCRRELPQREIVLGCARPGGEHKQITDLYALASGVDSIAFPADGTVEAAQKMGYETSISYSCCSMAIAGAVAGGTCRAG